MYGIFPYIWLIFMVNVGNVGKYTSPMDPMAIDRECFGAILPGSNQHILVHAMFHFLS